MKKIMFLFIIFSIISCNNNDDDIEIHTCPNQEIITNEPNIIKYSTTHEYYGESILKDYEVLNNKVQKQTDFQILDNGNTLIFRNESLYIYDTCDFLIKIDRYSNNHNGNYGFDQTIAEFEYDIKGQLVKIYFLGKLLNISGDDSPTFEYLNNTVSYKEKYNTNGQKWIQLKFNDHDFITDYIEYAEYFGSTIETRYKYIYDSKNRLIKIEMRDDDGKWIIYSQIAYSDLINPIGTIRNRMFGRKNNTLLNFIFNYGENILTSKPYNEVLFMPENINILETLNGVAIKFYNYEFLIE